MPEWILAAMRDITGAGGYGRVVLHFEAGDVQRVTVERSIRPPK